MGNFTTRQTNQVLHSICKSSITATPRTKSKCILVKHKAMILCECWIFIPAFSPTISLVETIREDGLSERSQREGERGRGGGLLPKTNLPSFFKSSVGAAHVCPSVARLNRLRSRFVRSLLISSDDESSFREEISDGGMKRERAQTTDGHMTSRPHKNIRHRRSTLGLSAKRPSILAGFWQRREVG